MLIGTFKQSSRSWKLQIKQCERTKGQKCIHPLATYNVEGSDGSLKANDGKYVINLITSLLLIPCFMR